MVMCVSSRTTRRCEDGTYHDRRQILFLVLPAEVDRHFEIAQVGPTAPPQHRDEPSFSVSEHCASNALEFEVYRSRVTQHGCKYVCPRSVWQGVDEGNAMDVGSEADSIEVDESPSEVL